MHRTRAVRTTLVAVSAGAVLVGGVALAAGGPSGQGGQPPQGGQRGQGGQHRGGPGGGVAFLHAEGTVKTSTGTEVDAVQQGTVTTIDATSLTVTSTDGYVGTYVIASTTKYRGTTSNAAPAIGDEVDVVAVVASGTSTAKTVSEHKAPKPKPSASSASASASTTG